MSDLAMWHEPRIFPGEKSVCRYLPASRDASYLEEWTYIIGGRRKPDVWESNTPPDAYIAVIQLMLR